MSAILTHVLFVIELGSRRVHLAGCTFHPTGEWVVQQARNLAWKLQDGELTVRFLLHDRDAKFTAAFRSEGVKVIRLPYRSPRASSFPGLCRQLDAQTSQRARDSSAGLV